MDDGILDPEDWLLLSATVRTSSPTEQSLSPPERRSLSWDRMFQLARSNRVAGFVCELLEAQPAVCPEERVRSRWRRLHSALALENEFARRQLHELSKVLQGEGIAALLYKGLDFEARFYARRGLRSFSDIDLIVAPDDVERADRGLQKAGFHLRPGSLPLDYYRRFHLHAVYQHQTWRFPLELHWALDSPYSQVETPLPALFAAAVKTDEFGPQLLSPSTLDALALMALHLEKHLDLCASLPSRETRLKAVLESKGLIWVVDILCWFHSQASAYGPDMILRRMEELDAERSLAVALRLACDLDPEHVPLEVAVLADPPQPRRSLLASAVYPDLGRGRGISEFGRRVRALLLRVIPILTFRPVRILELVLPRPGRSKRRRRGWLRRVSLGVANVYALARWKLRRSRQTPR